MLGVDVVFHFAALAIVSQSVTHPEEYFDVNVRGSENVLLAMKNAKIGKIVFASSCAVYGDRNSGLITEKSNTIPINSYGQSKLDFDNLLRRDAFEIDICAISLRFFNVGGAVKAGKRWFGETHEPETHLIPLIMKSSSNNPLIIHGTDVDTTDGTCIRDFVHVDDITDAFILCLNLASEPGHLVINLGSGKGSSVMEVISMASKIKQMEISFKRGPSRLEDPAYLVADNKLAAEKIGWIPSRNLEDIISDAFHFLIASQTE
jgi:UDP-glucose 4-epimerase